MAMGLLGGSLACRAQTNNWTSPSSGHWEDASWSLGILPAANQSVMITNAGSKAVGIFPTTPANFPGSMTVSNLMVSAPGGSRNTLLLNFVGTATPLKIQGACLVGTNGSMINLNSALVVGSNGLYLVGGDFWQQGGVTTVPEFGVESGNAAITNAMFTFGSAFLANGSSFTQSGGTVTSSDMTLSVATVNLQNGFFSTRLFIGEMGTGHLVQQGGRLESSSIFISDGDFLQHGGVVTNQGLTVGRTPSEASGFYLLDGGVLQSGYLSVQSGSFVQSNGVHTVTGEIAVYGFFEDYVALDFASYTLQKGWSSCAGMDVGMFGSFDQVDGTNQVSGDISVDATGFFLGAGMLCDSNTIVRRGELFLGETFYSTAFFQNGGVHCITNSLSCDGTYDLSAGTLIAPAIILRGELDIGPSPVATISNAISFDLAGTLQLSNSTQRLAAMSLSGNSLINFSSGACKLSFADRSGSLVWDSGATLIISNWNGSLSGGGMDQLFFGNSASGLLPSELQQIQFINPSGLPPGTWFAKLLPTGELVPTTQPLMTASLSGTKLLVQWPALNGFVLQAATNPGGPFEDIPNAPDPFTNDLAQFPQRFFRLRQP